MILRGIALSPLVAWETCCPIMEATVAELCKENNFSNSSARSGASIIAVNARWRARLGSISNWPGQNNSETRSYFPPVARARTNKAKKLFLYIFLRGGIIQQIKEFRKSLRILVEQIVLLLNIPTKNPPSKQLEAIHPRGDRASSRTISWYSIAPCVRVIVSRLESISNLLTNHLGEVPKKSIPNRH